VILGDLFYHILNGARYVVGAAFVAALAVALTHWLVREGRLQPFGPWPRFVRRASDPVLQPIERRLSAAGGNPQHAPWWLLAGVIVGGLVLLALLRGLFGWILTLSAASAAGPTALVALLVNLAFSVLMFALLVRVIGSWIGLGRYNRWMRPAYFLTDWLVEPLRQRIPPMGFIDVSPLVAYLLLMLARMVVFRVLF
jgi:YggT family protein